MKRTEPSTYFHVGGLVLLVFSLIWGFRSMLRDADELLGTNALLFLVAAVICICTGTVLNAIVALGSVINEKKSDRP